MAEAGWRRPPLGVEVEVDDEAPGGVVPGPEVVETEAEAGGGAVDEEEGAGALEDDGGGSTALVDGGGEPGPEPGLDECWPGPPLLPGGGCA